MSNFIQIKLPEKNIISVEAAKAKLKVDYLMWKDGKSKELNLDMASFIVLFHDLIEKESK